MTICLRESFRSYNKVGMLSSGRRQRMRIDLRLFERICFKSLVQYDEPTAEKHISNKARILVFLHLYPAKDPFSPNTTPVARLPFTITRLDVPN